MPQPISYVDLDKLKMHMIDGKRVQYEKMHETKICRSLVNKTRYNYLNVECTLSSSALPRVSNETQKCRYI